MHLNSYSKNPILSPTKNDWESKAVMNCGVTKYKGKIYIIYRAVDKENISRFGLAISNDGFTIEKRFNKPVFSPKKDYEALGVEDPRITKMGNSYYITYTGYRHKLQDTCITRAALAVTKDFRKFQRLGIILPNENNKDVVLFPQKINGRYAILHRRVPDIWLAYSKDLINWTDHKKILYPRSNKWDCEKIGAGGPPIKTKEGWLLFYHGVDKNKIYRLGVLLMDADNPSRVFRYDDHILEPTEKWEKKGLVPNVVFTCGAVKIGDKIFVYYGGADKYIGVATIKKKELLKGLI